MAKRRALKQGGPDEGEEEEDELEDVPTYNSNPEEIAKRPMKGLPKRGLRTANSPPAPAPADGGSGLKPTGFSGFGAPASQSSSFSFGAKLPSTTSSSSQSSPSLFSAMKPIPAPSFPSFVPKSADKKDDEVVFEYYKSLRGLNNSLITTLQDAIKADAFADLRAVLGEASENYGRHYSKIQDTLDSTTRTEESKKSEEAKPAPPPIVPTFAPPSAPTTGLIFGGKTISPATTSSSKPLPGSTDKGSSNSAPLSFPAFKPPTSAATASAPTTTPTFSFGAVSEPVQKPKSIQENTPTFTSTFATTEKTDATLSSKPVSSAFAPSSGAGGGFTSLQYPAFSTTSTPAASFPKPEPKDASKSDKPSTSFAATDSQESKGDEKSLAPLAASPFSAFGGFGAKPAGTSAFGGSGFGTSGFSFAPPSNSSSAPAASSSPVSNSAFANVGAFSTPAKSVPIGFGFGGASSKPVFTSPVGFGFGSPPKEVGSEDASASPTKAPKEKETSSWPAPAPAGGGLFASFGSSSAAKPASPDITSGEASQEESTGDAPDPAMNEPKESAADVEGEGEEDETSLLTMTSKLLKFDKTKGKWDSVGVGAIKIKKHKTTGKRRVLFRVEASKKVGANFNFFTGMKIAAQKTLVTFPGFEGQELVTYGVRLTTPENATTLKDSLQESVDSLSA